MKVFLTGATGVAGRATVPALVAAGHDVRAVSRRPEASAVLEAPPETSMNTLRSLLEAVADELMVEIRLSDD